MSATTSTHRRRHWKGAIADARDADVRPRRRARRGSAGAVDHGADRRGHSRVGRVRLRLRSVAVKMTDKKVWLVTGAGRGMGVDIAKATLAAGYAVVATGRNTERVAQAIGEHDDLLVVELDVTSPASAQTATTAALERFGRIDVLVNNAGN